MTQKNITRLIAALVQILFYKSTFIKKNTDLNKISIEVLDYINATPWYIKYTCLCYLNILEYFYLFYSFKFNRFSRSSDINKQTQYIKFWRENRFFAARMLFKIIFSITGMITCGQPKILDELGYSKDLNKKLNYDL